MHKSTYRKGMKVRLTIGTPERTGVLVRRVGSYLQWLVEFPDETTTFVWEADFVPANPKRA